MKRVLLLRHGKSKRGPEYDTDFERPLAGRGKRDSVKLGEHLVQQDLVPDLIYSSPAQRARQTAERCAEAAGYGGEIWFHDALYMGGVDAYLGLLAATDDTVITVLFVGHNPDMAEMVETLSRRWARMPTAALARIEFEVEHWGDIVPGEGTLVSVQEPRAL